MRLNFPLDPAKLIEGDGLDANWPTLLDDGRQASAAEVVATCQPSSAMYAFASEITTWLHEQGGCDVDCVADYRASSDRPGGLMIRWGGAVATAAVAEQFGQDGKLPCWLELRHDHDYDRRFHAPAETAGWLLAPVPLGVRSRPSSLADRLVLQ